MSRALAESFDRLARAMVKAHPALPHEWRDEGHQQSLVFPPQGGDGFEVWVVISEDNLIVGAGAVHEHFEIDDRDADTVAARALRLVHDLLSPASRLVERRASGRTYHSRLELRNRDSWTSRGSAITWSFNWFGSRSEHIRQNRMLEALENTR